MRRALMGFLAAGLLTACGDRDDKWDADDAIAASADAVGLEGSVAVRDDARDEVIMLSSSGGLDLTTRRLPVGENVVAMVPSADRRRLFVLSRGAERRTRPEDEAPRLTIIDGGPSPKVEKVYDLTDPLGGLTVDPEGQWAVVYAAGGAVVNPNELILIDLTDPEQAPIEKTVRSFGSQPRRFTFTGELQPPQGPARRFLVVETDKEVVLIDLYDPTASEITVMLPEKATGGESSPAEVIASDGEADDKTDARLAVRLEGESSILIIELGVPDDETRDYKVTLNTAEVGGVPSAIDFVKTDGDASETDTGLRLAALVPSSTKAVLVDPATTTTVDVSLDGRFDRITRITDDVAAAPIRSDVALLWSTVSNRIAFWSLGRTAGKPFRAVESYEIGSPIAAVLDVPGDEYGHLKLLASSGQEFFVLDLDNRQSAPMVARDGSGVTLSVSPNGERAWAFAPRSRRFASVAFADLHPTSVDVERPIGGVFEIGQGAGEGRVVMALHDGDGLGATLVDATAPDGASSRFYPGLTLGGL